jgi:hypothetical protein
MSRLSSTIKSDGHDTAETLLKMMTNTNNPLIQTQISKGQAPFYFHHLLL